jgi:hypothetical protein
VHDVEEYITAYENAVTDSRLDDNWRTLSSYNGQYVLAGEQIEGEYPMRFVTWRYTPNGGVWSGNYFTDYNKAEKDFFERCGYERPLLQEQDFRIICPILVAEKVMLDADSDKCNELDTVLSMIERNYPEVVREAENAFYGDEGAEPFDD